MGLIPSDASFFICDCMLRALGLFDDLEQRAVLDDLIGLFDVDAEVAVGIVVGDSLAVGVLEGAGDLAELEQVVSALVAAHFDGLSGVHQLHAEHVAQVVDDAKRAHAGERQVADNRLPYQCSSCS